jgi:uncharacterized membrane protein
MDWIDLAQVGTSGRLLHKLLGSSWVAARLSASQEGLISKKLVQLVNGLSSGSLWTNMYLQLSCKYNCALEVTMYYVMYGYTVRTNITRDFSLL